MLHPLGPGNAAATPTLYQSPRRGRFYAPLWVSTRHTPKSSRRRFGHIRCHLPHADFPAPHTTPRFEFMAKGTIWQLSFVQDYHREYPGRWNIVMRLLGDNQSTYPDVHRLHRRDAGLPSPEGVVEIGKKGLFVAGGVCWALGSAYTGRRIPVYG